VRKLTGALAVVLTFAGVDRAAAVDLSPAHWPAAERARLAKAELSTAPATAREVSGKREIVAATLSPLAVRVGMETLAKGGTAADAAVAVAVTQITTDAGAVVSFAGVAQLLYFDARTRRVYNMDAGWGSYREETDPATIGPPSVTLTGAETPGAADGRKTLVPGFMAGMEAMHARFGKLAFADLFQPAIWYADNGIEVSPLLGVYFKARA
jgi:gamma-glutamyltranspeptidase / glutathione hydrolase